MKTAIEKFNYGSLMTVISEGITGLNPVMNVSKNPISAKPCIWDVTESYCAKKGLKLRRSYCSAINPSKLIAIRKIETTGTTQRKQITVDINGIINVYELGKKNEYFLNGQSLTKTLETLALSPGNKIKIY